MDRGTAFAPMRERNFRWYFFAQLVNLTGSTMAPVALAFAVLEVSDSASALGLVLASNSLPLVVFMLFGGVIADRLPRELVLRVGNLVLAATQGSVAFLVLTDSAQLWMLMALEALNGLTLAICFPALAAIMPSLVPRAMLQQANVLQSMMRGSLRVFGPATGGILVVTVGPGWAMAVDALTYVVAAALLLGVRVPRRERGEEPSSTMTELREGWTLFWGTTWLWVIVCAFGVLNAIHTGAFFTLGPPIAKDSIGEDGWGLVLSAESLGLVAMTVVLLRWRLERPLLLGMLGMATFAIPLFMLGTEPVLVALVLAAFIAGAGTEVFSLGWSLAMQENIDERLLSRAYSYDALGSFAAMPIGQLVYGPLGAAFGYDDVLVVSAVVYVAVALSTLLSPSVRNLRRDVAAASAP